MGGIHSEHWGDLPVDINTPFVRIAPWRVNVLPTNDRQRVVFHAVLGVIKACYKPELVNTHIDDYDGVYVGLTSFGAARALGKMLDKMLPTAPLEPETEDEGAALRNATPKVSLFRSFDSEALDIDGKELNIPLIEFGESTIRCRACEIEQEIEAANSDDSLQLGERTELVQDLRTDLSNGPPHTHKEKK